MPAPNTPKIGRNDPCPCGSGKKFKHCCIEQHRHVAPDAIADLPNDLRDALAGRNFDTKADVEAFMEQHSQQRNRAGIADFQGLSPDQMHRALYQPFDSPEVVRFADCLDSEPTAPIMTLFLQLATRIAEERPKATAKGNLPRDFCRAAALATLGESAYREHTRYGDINRETDYFELHVTRVVAELAGLIRKHKGRFILSRECRTLLEQGGSKAIYPRLLRAYVQRFNWAYGDGYAELPFVQQSFVFTLYLLHRFGATEQPRRIYEDAFLRAFPAVFDELNVSPSPLFDAERTLRSCYGLRALVRFLGILGLARLETVGVGVEQEYRITRLPLFRAAVRFPFAS